MVESSPVAYTESAMSAGGPHFVIRSDVDIRLSTGYRRTLPAKSEWRLAGRVPQGNVFRPIGTVFTIEGRNIHEAYLVMSGRDLVGFYLPGESQYSALASPVALPIGEQQ